MLKYLRITVTALSLTACVLLVALWVWALNNSNRGPMFDWLAWVAILSGVTLVVHEVVVLLMRPWRFSLRTLLIATTLVAVVLGAVAYTR